MWGQCEPETVYASGEKIKTAFVSQSEMRSLQKIMKGCRRGFANGLRDV